MTLAVAVIAAAIRLLSAAIGWPAVVCLALFAMWLVFAARKMRNSSRK